MNKRGVVVPVAVALFVETYNLYSRTKFALIDLRSVLRNEREFESLEFGDVRLGLRKFRSSNVLVNVDGLFIKNLARRASRKTKDEKEIDDILNSVAGVVGKAIRYNLNVHLKTSIPNSMVLPARYFWLHGGVCRHQSAIVAGVLQRVRDDGLVSGSIKVVHGFREDLQSGHAWVEVHSADRRFVVDATNRRATADPLIIWEDYDKTYPIRPYFE